ncbi:NAD(P)/FAD-dependent oxidoreductase [Cupriavidus gilardii]|uniref:NAD(P)/FAD-dependent oxidoreductase n=1 Tax=Cupriavidus gilardii TaxID=82541 RepID=UPI001EE634E9|nr:NAD(P)/FAD-dependent oxidoreductase [Cupriavidus gilardii]MCG5262095.1 NAD(P)/FAD-dependent oxidoreductase [Cupriavidus gilardii]MDF9430705.1 NAD(P)/FAD-dependent oxidoreductase [Cupriavidus gilardii]
MSKQVVIVGAGFAGMYAALAAARLRDRHGVAPDAIEIVVVAPEAALTLRPRLYESAPARMAAPLDALFDTVGVRFVEGWVETIDTTASRIALRDGEGQRGEIGYDRLVLAAGSRLAMPAVPGLAQFAFSVDQREDAVALERHLQALAERPRSTSRNTVVVAGGGFTGIETAAELPARLRLALGDDGEVHVVIVERAAAIGPDLGPGPRPVIEQALDALGVQRRLGVAVASVDANGVLLSDGARIDAATVIWTGGVQATALTREIPAERDGAGRLLVDRDLRVPGAPGVFAAGDAASAQTDEAGHRTLMSCQHAMPLGRVAGNNAMADLLGVPATPYAQPRYVTCLDLGPWGAVLTEGWQREVRLAGAEAKTLKRQINQQWIYPPLAHRGAAFEMAEPGYHPKAE